MSRNNHTPGLVSSSLLQLPPTEQGGVLDLMSGVRAVVRRVVPNYARSRIHFAIMDNSLLAELYTKIDGTKLTQITDETRLVLEGCPRSGNSYALGAFSYANPGVGVASHRHSPTAVRTGLRRGKPVIVIIRPPRDTIASGLQYYPDQPAHWAIRIYRKFHEGILPMADRFMVATFEEVTTDFGSVIRRCNERFGTSFVPYEATPDSERAVREMVDAWALKDFTPGALHRVVASPNSSRLSADELLPELDEKFQAEIEELDKLYQAVLLHREVPFEPGMVSRQMTSPKMTVVGGS
jgi:hypothetical protein